MVGWLWLEIAGAGVVGTENTPKYTQKYREAGLKEWLQRVYGSCHPTQFTPP